MAAKKIVVLKNKNGSVVRTLQGFEEKPVHIIRRKDTGRIEAHAEVDSLTDVPFELLGTYKTSDLKSPVDLGSFGTLEAVPKVEEASLWQDFQQDNEGELKAIVKWTSLVHVGLLVLLLAVTSLISYITKEEEVLVEVFTQEVKLEERATPPPTVQMSKTKPVAKRQAPKKAVKKTAPKKVAKQRAVPTKSSVSRSTKKSQARAAQPQKPKSLGQMGALGALGGPSGSGRKGLDIGKAGAKGVAGLGSGGSSGVGRAVHSVGLIAVTSGGGSGAGSGARGGGGYSTRGVGSGQGEYGKHSLGGASAGYINPMSAESEIDGGLDKAAVDAVVRRNKGQIQYCYERSLQSKPSLAGRVNLRWTIAASGRVSSIGVVSNSLADQNVVNCMMSKVRSWQFPKPVGGVNVKVTQYPFDLRKNF